jgi:sorbitol/mannitol transport system substrate-binding protein
MRFIFTLSATVLLNSFSLFAEQKQITIAAVNNPEMIELQKLSSKFEAGHPDIKVNWVMMDENILRQRISTDVAQQAGQYDLVFIGLYETPIFAKKGWLVPFEKLPVEYDLEDVFKSLRVGLSSDGKLFALPFYGESSMLMYRKDLVDAKGLKVPENPTYDDVAKLADALTDKSTGIYGITLRGLPGWGESMAFVSTLLNTFGATWFDMDWRPTINTEEWKKAVGFYVDLLKKDGPPDATSNGFLENLDLMAKGKAAMWIDATSAGGSLEDPKRSEVAGKIGYVQAPVQATVNGSHWLWSWSFAIPTSAKNREAAQEFAVWATSKEYINLVAADAGWVSVPPGTRKSTYDNTEYQKAAPFAAVTLQAILSADPTNPCIKKVPYTGIQFVETPGFQSIGEVAAQNIAAVLEGKESIDRALENSQTAAEQIMASIALGGEN